jgi:branched-subunit amino acid aminotransferase/4-amino-4-deoxychorismate lyase
MTANRPAPNLPSLKQQTALDPLASALLLDETGHVTETAAANFLIVRKGTVVTPPRSRVLPGISLAMVEKLCQDLGIPFVEEPLGPADCYAADEALLTSTSFCLAGVSRIDGHSIPWPGPIWQRLLAVWSERVGVDIARQIFAHR